MPGTAVHPGRPDLHEDLVDVVFGEISLPSGDGGWKRAMRQRAVSVREVLGRRRWAIGLIESRRSPGPATLRRHDAMLGCLRGARFPIELTTHAYSPPASYICGFALREASLPFGTAEETTQVTREIAGQMPAGEYPYLTEMATGPILQPGYRHAQLVTMLAQPVSPDVRSGVAVPAGLVPGSIG